MFKGLTKKEEVEIVQNVLNIYRFTIQRRLQHRAYNCMTNYDLHVLLTYHLKKIQVYCIPRDHDLNNL